MDCKTKTEIIKIKINLISFSLDRIDKNNKIILNAIIGILKMKRGLAELKSIRKYLNTSRKDETISVLNIKDSL